MKTHNLFLSLLPFLSIAAEASTETHTRYNVRDGYVIFYGGHPVTGVQLEHQLLGEVNNRLTLNLYDAESVDSLFDNQFHNDITVHEISKPVFGVIENVVVRDYRPRVDILASDYAIFPLVAITKEELTRIVTQGSPGQIITLTVKTALPIANYPETLC